MADTGYDVIIVGGSFAGLAVAMQLQGRRVLIVDQHPIGSHQMSACGTPLTTVRAVGAGASILGTHDDLVLHTNNRAIHFPLKDPYVTFDYQAFCLAMAAQTDAEIWRAGVTSINAHGVETTRGPAAAKFVVDASGWRSSVQNSVPAHRRDQGLGYGLETELPVRWDDPGLHFFFAKHLVRNGYAWVFPCGDTTRFGVGSFEKELKLRQALVQFLDPYCLQVGRTHGGLLAIARRPVVHGNVFLVGDSAGQCLPMTGEGIRTAIFHGIHCGQALAGALAGAYTRKEASELYQLQVRSTEQFHDRLHLMQSIVARMPESLLTLAGQILARSTFATWAMDRYLVQSGWFLASLDSSKRIHTYQKLPPTVMVKGT